jgi:hypothetical protein
MGANAVNFNGFMMDCEARLLEFPGHRLHHHHARPLLDFMALNANEQQLLMLTFRAVTAYERIQAFDPVYQTLLDQKLQGAVNRGRLGGILERPDPVEQIVCLHSPVTFPDQFEHLATYRREPRAPFCAELFRRPDRFADAAIVIMSGCRSV